jgi:hypothetical protein
MASAAAERDRSRPRANVTELAPTPARPDRADVFPAEARALLPLPAMKTAAQTKKQPSKERAKASRESTAPRRAEKPAAPVRVEAPARPRDAAAGTPMPDLTPFGVDPRDAEAHVGQCEQCGRAHRHVMKNPKDAMALESFGRNLAVCLAGKPSKPAA